MATDIALKNPDEIAALPTEQRGRLVTRALEESKSWLATAVKGSDPTPVQEFKAWAATVEEMTRQKGLSEDIRLDAQEMVLRATRAIALVVEQGQQQEPPTVARHGGRNGHNVSLPAPKSPMEFYSDKREKIDATDMAKGVSAEDFDEVIQEGRAERNLARRGIARKSRARSGREVIPRDTSPIDVSEYTGITVEVGDPVCPPVVFRREKLDELRGWAEALSQMIPDLSIHEREEMHKELLRLDHQLRTIPLQQFEESKS